MSRSIKKGPFADASLLKKIEAQEGSEKKQVIKTWSRRSTIFPSFLGISPTYSYRTIYPFVQCVNIIFTPPLHMSYFHHFPYKIHLFLCIMTSFSRADFLTSAYTI